VTRQQRLRAMLECTERRLGRAMRLKRRPRWMINHLIYMTTQLEAIGAKRAK
jgi:Uri superfamily endonuclease